MDESGKLFFKGTWSAEQLAEMNMKISDTFNPYFQMQNKFADQSTINNVSAEYSDKSGVQSIYYVTSLYNPPEQSNIQYNVVATTPHTSGPKYYQILDGTDITYSTMISAGGSYTLTITPFAGIGQIYYATTTGYSTKYLTQDV